MDRIQAHRRPVVVGLAGAAALGVATAATKLAASLGDHDGEGRRLLALSSDSSQMGSLTVRLGDDLLPRRADGSWRSTELATTTHSMVGFTWTGPHRPQVQIRSRARGTWTHWQRVPVMHDEPDAGTAEASRTRGTHLVWIGDSDGIHIQVEGDRPADLALVLLHPGRLASDRTAHARAPRAPRGPAARRRSGVPQPALLSRKAWGADESLRTGSPQYNTTLEQVHVHHTASGNDYAAEDVPALLRGFYRYHTRSLGWSDIGYNFLVDKFGRIWVGRYGGPTKLVRGAHTLGFNATSTGVSVIGNYEATAPSAPVVAAVAHLAAWKLSAYGRDPLATVSVVSEGSDKYRARRVATLPVIDGHRDTNDTACPGSLLYERLPAIRTRAQQLIATGGVATAIVALTPPTLTGGTALGQTITIVPGTYDPPDAVVTYAWLRNGVAIPGAVGPAYVTTAEDLGAVVSVQVTASKTGYTALTQTVEAVPAVATTTTLRVTSKRRYGRAVLRVHVRGVGTAVRPTGTVTVALRKQTRQVALVNGLAVATFDKVRRGRTTATISYGGAAGYAPSTTTASVVVARRRRR